MKTRLSNKFAFFLALMLFVAVVLAGCAPNTETGANAKESVKENTKENVTENVKEKQEKPVTIAINNWAPSTHHWKPYVFEPWKKEVESKTNGRVKIDIYDGAVLGGTTSVLQDVSGGKYQLGFLVYNYFYDTPYFLGTIGELPFALNDTTKGSKIQTQFIDKYAKDKFDTVHYVGTFATDPYVLFSRKPIHSVNDLKGLKIRTPGKTWNPIIQAWGANPVSIQLNDAYEALQRGTIDAIPYSVVGGVGFKYQEVAPYVVNFGLFSNVAAILLNKETYKSIPDDLKPVFDKELFPKLSQLVVQDYKDRIDETYKGLSGQLKGKGELIELPDAEKALIEKPAKVAWDNWVTEANKRKYPGDEMMREFKRMMTEEGLSLPF